MITGSQLISMIQSNAITVVIFYVLTVIGQWKVFEKAGEAGWKSLIPIYNMYILFKIIGMSYIKMLVIVFVLCILLVVFPIVAVSSGISALAFGTVISSLALLIYIFVVTCKMCDNLSKAFGHGFGFALGLFLMQPIFLIILGFNKDEYKGIVKK